MIVLRPWAQVLLTTNNCNFLIKTHVLYAFTSEANWKGVGGAKTTKKCFCFWRLQPLIPVLTLMIYSKLTVDSSDESRLRMYNCTLTSTAPFSEKEHAHDVNSGSNNNKSYSGLNMAYQERLRGTHDRHKSEVSRQQLFAYKKNSIKYLSSEKSALCMIIQLQREAYSLYFWGSFYALY